jgi:uncharacterized protein (DUF2336 family)
MDLAGPQHHEALAGGISTSQLRMDLAGLRHHQALAGGISTSQLPVHKSDFLAAKLKHHRLKPGGVSEGIDGVVASCKIEAPPAKARWCLGRNRWGRC